MAGQIPGGNKMTNVEFMNGFNQLAEAFNVSKQDIKARIYFKELEYLGVVEWDKAIREILRDQERFPTISMLIAICQKHKPNNGDHAEFSCKHCDGRGGVQVVDVIFRARCHHGRTMVPQYIPLLPESFDERRVLEFRLLGEWKDIYGADWPHTTSHTAG